MEKGYSMWASRGYCKNKQADTQAQLLWPARYNTSFTLRMWCIFDNIFLLFQRHMKLIKCSYNYCFFALILICFTISSLTCKQHPFPSDSWGLSAKKALTMISPQKTGYLDTFTSLEKRIFKKALIEHVCWVDARIAVDLKQLGPRLCLHWPDAKWLNQHDKSLETEKWRKEFILLWDQTTDC